MVIIYSGSAIFYRRRRFSAETWDACIGTTGKLNPGNSFVIYISDECIYIVIYPKKPGKGMGKTQITIHISKRNTIRYSSQIVVKVQSD